MKPLSLIIIGFLLLVPILFGKRLSKHIYYFLGTVLVSFVGNDLKFLRPSEGVIQFILAVFYIVVFTYVYSNRYFLFRGRGGE